MNNREVKDEKLWRMAKKRANFKRSVALFFIINGLLIADWYFETGPGFYFWPAWCMLVWGAALVYQCFDAYLPKGIFTPESEFEKLKKKRP